MIQQSERLDETNKLLKEYREKSLKYETQLREKEQFITTLESKII